MIVSGVVMALAAAQMFSALGLSADQVAAIQAGILLFAGGIRILLEKRNEARVQRDMERTSQAAMREGLYKPVPAPRKYKGGEGGKIGPAAIVLLLMAAPLMACGGAVGSVIPTLGAVLSRVDVPRLLDCAGHLPDYGAAAKCLGARALTQGLRIAMDEAVRAAEQAELLGSGAGAADASEADKADMAKDLDASLDRLAVEIDATYH